MYGHGSMRFLTVIHIPLSHFASVNYFSINCSKTFELILESAHKLLFRIGGSLDIELNMSIGYLWDQIPMKKMTIHIKMK